MTETMNNPQGLQTTLSGGNGGGNGGSSQVASPAAPVPPSPPEVPKAAGWHKYTVDLPRNCPHLSAPWRQAVQRAYALVLCDLLRIPLAEGDEENERKFLIQQVLEDANQASRQGVGLRKWWWGTEIERSWGRLHEVGQRTVDLLPEGELLSHAAFASARGSRYLEPHDKRLLHLEALRAQAVSANPGPSSDALRAAVVEVLRATSAQSDRISQEARSFRNRLLIASVFSILSTVMLVVVQWRSRDGWLLDPPRHWNGSAWVFLVDVMLFGAIGALFTAIPAMSKIPSDFSPFNLPIQQAILKIAFGPLVAVIGLAILSSRTLHLAPPDTWPALLLFAVVFGAGQHAVTRYVDQRADAILTAVAPAPSSTTT
jgi:hypothetical protein